MFRIGTRGSLLATTQAGHIRDALISNGYEAELTIITTPGDIIMSPVERIGVGVFTQALRDAMDRGECDIAVHSFKDLPTAPDPRFQLVTPVREDPREALVARDGLTLADLPRGARVGTSAPRRVSQLRSLRPDLDIRPLRGNIDTRMGTVTEGVLDAVMLAAAGLSRVGRLGDATELLDPDVVMPAPAQGILAVECSQGNPAASAALTYVADDIAGMVAAAERAVLAELQAGCTAPVAAHAHIDGCVLHLRAGVFALDGRRRVVRDVEARVESIEDAEAAGRQAARTLLKGGAGEILADS